MELVFAQLALETGLFRGKEYLFSLLILMAFVSTILAPILFKVYYNRAVAAGEVPLQPSEQGIMDLDLDTSQYA
jgi:hypothetical protein